MRSLATLSLLFLIGVALAQPDETYMDLTFDSDGYVRLDFTDQDYASAVLADGSKLVAAMISITPNQERISRIMRYNPDGTLDASFGTNGVVTLSIPGGAISIYSIALAPNGNLILAGYSSPVQFGADVYIASLLPDGTFDATFGTNGVLTTDLGGTDIAYKMAIDGAGNIFAAGATSGAGSDPFTCKLSSSGLPDASFGTNGFSISTAAPYEVFQDLIVTADGNLLAAGSSGSDAIIHKIDAATGSPIPGFGNGGVHTILAPLSPTQNFTTVSGIVQQTAGLFKLLMYVATSTGYYSSILSLSSTTAAADPNWDQNSATATYLEQYGADYYVGMFVAGFYLAAGADPTGVLGEVLVVHAISGLRHLLKSGAPPPPSPTFTFGIPGSPVVFLDAAADTAGNMLFIGTATDTAAGNQDVIIGRIIVGNFEPVTTVSVQEIATSEVPLSVSPNPVTDEVMINVDMPKAVSDAQLQILSITGELVLERTFSNLHQGNNAFRIGDLEGLSRGTYLVNIVADGMLGTIEFQKL